MKNALILHGTLGNSKENWFPWLKKQLEKKGYLVWLPDLPDANVPNLRKYFQFVFSNPEWRYDSESIIIGHSSGSVAALGILNELPSDTVIDTCVLVAVFEKNSPGGKWEPNKELFDYKFDLNKIKTKARRFVFIISDNDPYCPVDYVKKLSGTLKGELIITHGDGHFSVSSGGEKFKQLPIIVNILDNDELLDLVNTQDKVIGTVWKSEAHQNPKLIHREVDISVFTKQGDVLLQQRGKLKTTPGAWRNSASGHVKSGEKPVIAVKRELFEELGIKVKPVFFQKLFDSNEKQSRFFWMYYAVLDKKAPLTIDQSEVMSAKWVNYKDLERYTKLGDLSMDPLTLDIFRKCFNIIHKNDELLDLVDKNDKVIGTVWKSEAHRNPKLIHREIAIALFNDRKETLLQRRSMNKQFDPGMWQISAAGHVGAHENPIDAAKREVKEEIGIKCNPIYVKKEYIKNENQARFFYVYYALVESEVKIKINRREVIDTVWIKPSKIDKFSVTNNYNVDWKSKKFVQETLKKF